MKKIVLIFLLAFVSNVVYSQTVKEDLKDAGKEIKKESKTKRAR